MNMPWKTVWQQLCRSHFSDPRALHRSIATHWLEVRILMDRELVDSAVGYVALEAYFSGRPEITAEYVAERLRGMMSDDTARRRLDRMYQKQVVIRRKGGRTLFYRLRPEIAEAAIAAMQGDAAFPESSG